MKLYTKNISLVKEKTQPLIFTAFTLYTPKITNTISTNSISDKEKNYFSKGKR